MNMMKWTNLFPDEYKMSSYEIDYQKLYKEGFRGIIYDIDNTLVAHDAPANERAIKLLQEVRKLGFKICLLSNNKHPRVDLFNEKIGAYTVCEAGKPWRTGYIKAMQIMGTDRSDTIMIGDQILTDMWGANRTGVPCIMVKKLYRKEAFQVVLKRIPEAVIMLTYRIALLFGWNGKKRQEKKRKSR